MANLDAAFGFRPIGDLSGNAYCGKTQMYYMTAGAAGYLGTPVKLAGGADANGVPTVTVASINDVIVGVIDRVEPVTRSSTVYRESSVNRYVHLVPAQDTLFVIQEDSLVSTLAATEVGMNADWAGSGGSTSTGLSSVELDSDSAATDATLDMQIVGLYRAPDNEIGTNAQWIVRLNNHQYVDGTTGVS